MIIKEIDKNHKSSLITNNWKSYDDIINFLEKRGYKLIGSGFYSLVFAKPNSKYVIKLSKIYDGCYLKFVDYVLKQKRNPYLPKILFLRTYNDRNKRKLFVTAIEKLKRFYAIEKMNLWTVRDLPKLAWLSLITRHVQPYFREEFWDIYRQIDNSSYIANRSEIIDQYAKKFKSSLMARTYEQIKKELVNSKTGCGFDIHDNNIMYRPGKNELVFTDPINGFDVNVSGIKTGIIKK